MEALNFELKARTFELKLGNLELNRKFFFLKKKKLATVDGHVAMEKENVWTRMERIASMYMVGNRVNRK